MLNMKKRQEFLSSTRLATVAFASLLPMSFLLSCSGGVQSSAAQTRPQTAQGGSHAHTHHHHEHSHASGKKHEHKHEHKHEQEKQVDNSHTAKGYASSLVALEQSELALAAAKRGASEAKSFFEALSGIPAKVVALHSMYEELKKIHNKIQKLTRTLEAAEQDVVIAGQRNWRLGKEVMLYIFTLKFFWGMFTGYAPTTSTSEQVERLATVKEEVGKELEEAKVEHKLLEGRFKKAIDALKISYDVVLKKAFSPAFKNKVLSSKLAVVRIFEGLIAAIQEEQQRQRMFREELRNQYPTVPYSVALSMEISEDEQRHYFTNYHRHKLHEAASELMLLELSLAHILSIVELEGKTLTKFSPTVLLAKAAEMVEAAETSLAEASEKAEWAKHAVESLETDAELIKEYNSQPMLIQEVVTSKSEVKKQSEAGAAGLTRAEHFYRAIETLRNSLFRVHSLLSSVSAIENELEVASDLVVMRENALRKAAREKYSFFRELGLYILGFKWLWGGRSGYAPTVNTSEESKALEEAREVMSANVKYRMDELTQLKSEFERSLTLVEENYKALLSKTQTPAEVATLNRFYVKFRSVIKSFTRAMEEYASARELYLRDQVSYDLFEGFSLSEFLRAFGGSIKDVLQVIPQTKSYASITTDVKNFVEVFDLYTPIPQALTLLGQQAERYKEVKQQFDTFFKVVAGVIFDKLISPEQEAVVEEEAATAAPKKAETKEQKEGEGKKNNK